MAGNKKPRKPHRSRGNAKLPIVFATPPELVKKHQLGAHSSLDALRLGQGDGDCAQTVMHAILLALELRKHAAPDPTVDEVIADGLAAIRRVYKRHEERKVWGFTGDEFSSLKEALTVSDSLQALCTRREVRDAALAVCVKVGA